MRRRRAGRLGVLGAHRIWAAQFWAARRPGPLAGGAPAAAALPQGAVGSNGSSRLACDPAIAGQQARCMPKLSCLDRGRGRHGDARGADKV